MAIVADHIYSMTGQPAALAWLGSFAYTLQIFFDFSAYSDMAIGLGLIFGFEFRENFNYPYISKSISEFWRRWHISLGEWFRDYVYFPLGGSKVKNTDRMVFNLLVVWMLTGIWHGANWTFFAWGLLNFVFIAFEKLTNFAKNNKLNILKHIYTLIVVNFGWVLFRSESLLAAGKYFESMFGVNGLWSDYTWMFIKEFWVFFAAGIIFSTPVAKRLSYLWVKSDSKLIKYSVGSASVVIYPVLAALLFLICMSYLVKGSYNPFIYFNF
jgi:alginate O-acetyltransferase complex protein AlgI